MKKIVEQASHRIRSLRWDGEKAIWLQNFLGWCANNHIRLDCKQTQNLAESKMTCYTHIEHKTNTATNGLYLDAVIHAKITKPSNSKDEKLWFGSIL
jgi:hypothetical protein